jgi:hypothetical protein
MQHMVYNVERSEHREINEGWQFTSRSNGCSLLSGQTSLKSYCSRTRSYCARTICYCARTKCYCSSIKRASSGQSFFSWQTFTRNPEETMWTWDFLELYRQNGPGWSSAVLTLQQNVESWPCKRARTRTALDEDCTPKLNCTLLTTFAGPEHQ